jgi:hypothetical protein
MGEALASVEKQIAGEKAAALGRSGRKLRIALESLRRFDEGVTGRGTRSDQTVRTELVEVAGDALWSYIVQREAMGLMDREYIGREYQVPADLWRWMRPRLSC